MLTVMDVTGGRPAATSAALSVVRNVAELSTAPSEALKAAASVTPPLVLTVKVTVTPPCSSTRRRPAEASVTEVMATAFVATEAERATAETNAACAVAPKVAAV